MWMVLMEFPKRLSALRKEHGLSQKTLAEEIGIHVTQVRRYEAGTSQPTAEVLRKIALALHVSADDLLFNPDERGPREDLRLHFEALSRLDEKERAIVKAVLEGLIIKHDAQRWAPAKAH